MGAEHEYIGKSMLKYGDRRNRTLYKRRVSTSTSPKYVRVLGLRRAERGLYTLVRWICSSVPLESSPAKVVFVLAPRRLGGCYMYIIVRFVHACAYTASFRVAVDGASWRNWHVLRIVTHLGVKQKCQSEWCTAIYSTHERFWSTLHSDFVFFCSSFRAAQWMETGGFGVVL